MYVVIVIKLLECEIDVNSRSNLITYGDIAKREYFKFCFYDLLVFKIYVVIGSHRVKRRVAKFYWFLSDSRDLILIVHLFLSDKV